jgi:hypothetical protein
LPGGRHEHDGRAQRPDGDDPGEALEALLHGHGQRDRREAAQAGRRPGRAEQLEAGGRLIEEGKRDEDERHAVKGGVQASGPVAQPRRHEDPDGREGQAEQHARAGGEPAGVGEGAEQERPRQHEQRAAHQRRQPAGVGCRACAGGRGLKAGGARRGPRPGLLQRAEAGLAGGQPAGQLRDLGLEA